MATASDKLPVPLDDLTLNFNCETGNRHLQLSTSDYSPNQSDIVTSNTVMGDSVSASESTTTGYDCLVVLDEPSSHTLDYTSLSLYLPVVDDDTSDYLVIEPDDDAIESISDVYIDNHGHNTCSGSNSQSNVSQPNSHSNGNQHITISETCVIPSPADLNVTTQDSDYSENQENSYNYNDVYDEIPASNNEIEYSSVEDDTVEYPLQRSQTKLRQAMSFHYNC